MGPRHHGFFSVLIKLPGEVWNDARSFVTGCVAIEYWNDSTKEKGAVWHVEFSIKS